MAEVWPQ